MTMKNEIRTILVFLLSILCSAVAWGQANTSLRGTVGDQSGAVVPKAQLSLTNSATVYSGETDLNLANNAVSLVSTVNVPLADW